MRAVKAYTAGRMGIADVDVDHSILVFTEVDGGNVLILVPEFIQIHGFFLFV
jgi:hypothetical protein